MLRIAALASSVVASIATVFPLSNPASTRRCCTQVNTTRCVSRSISRRVREIVEWSGTRFVQGDAEEAADRQRIRGAPRDAAFRIDAFKVANQQQTEIDPRRQTGPPHGPVVERLTEALDERIEVVVVQQRVHPLIERMRRGRRQVARRDPQIVLPWSLPSGSHRHARESSTKNRVLA